MEPLAIQIVAHPRTPSFTCALNKLLSKTNIGPGLEFPEEPLELPWVRRVKTGSLWSLHDEAGQ